MRPAPFLPEGTPSAISDQVRAELREALLRNIPEHLRPEAANALSGFDISPEFAFRDPQRDLFGPIQLVDDQVRNWVWALSGGGAKGAFQFGAMLYLSHDVRLFPKGIASTSVGSINLVGAAEANMRGIEKLKRNWLQTRNLHDIYRISPWVERMDRIRTFASLRPRMLQNSFEGSTPRSLHPDPESVDPDPLDRQIQSLINELPSHLELLALSIGNILTLGFGGAAAIEDIEETLLDLGEANRILREEADGIWRLDPMRDRVLSALDLDAIRHAGTHLRVVMVSLNDSFAYSVDDQLRVYRYSTDRISGRFAREQFGHVVLSLDFDNRAVWDHLELWTQVILASVSIPIINPPIRLITGTPLTPDHMVDGGVRETLPIEQAIDIITNDLEHVTGRKGIIAIVAGADNPSRSDYFFTELLPPRFDPTEYRFVDIATTSLEIAIEEIVSNELRAARDHLPEGIEGLVIAPSFLLGETTDIDPGIVQISIAYGWMTAFDMLKKAELGLSPDEYQAHLWFHTNLIAQARYAVWKLEREGTSFYHEHVELFAGLIRDRIRELDRRRARRNERRERYEPRPAGQYESIRRAVWGRVPIGWVFKGEARVGPYMTDVIARIRGLKREIKRLITLRVQRWGLESLPTVHDLSSFDVGNVNCFADWYRTWERHAVQPNTDYPTGPGLIHPDGHRVTHFDRFGSPWDAQHRYDVDLTLPAGNVRFDVGPGQIRFREVAAEPRGLAWFERDPDYTIVRLEGYVYDPGSGARDGTVPLSLLYSSYLADSYATTQLGHSEEVRVGGWISQTRREVYSFARSLGHIFDPERDQPPGTIPLQTWYSPRRSDHLTTADYWRFIEGNPVAHGGWTAVDIIEPGYSRARLEGYMFPPNRPQPEGTVPLYRWISFSRKDNYTTTDPTWAPTPS